MSNSIAPGSSADVNVKVTALTTNPNVPAQYKTIILKKNLVNGVNTLTQEMMSATNTKYVIKYDYVLGEYITVPENCILEFDGGSLSDNIIVLNSGCKIRGNGKLYCQHSVTASTTNKDFIKVIGSNIEISDVEIYSDITYNYDTTGINDNVIVAIQVYNGNNISIHDVKIHNVSAAIGLDTCDNIRVENNYIYDCFSNSNTIYGYGVVPNQSNNIIINGNIMNNIERHAIYVSLYNSIGENITVSNNIFNGFVKSSYYEYEFIIKIMSAKNVIIDSNIINSYRGILINPEHNNGGDVKICNNKITTINKGLAVYQSEHDYYVFNKLDILNNSFVIKTDVEGFVIGCCNYINIKHNTISCESSSNVNFYMTFRMLSEEYVSNIKYVCCENNNIKGFSKHSRLANITTLYIYDYVEWSGSPNPFDFVENVSMSDTTLFPIGSYTDYKRKANSSYNLNLRYYDSDFGKFIKCIDASNNIWIDDNGVVVAGRVSDRPNIKNSAVGQKYFQIASANDMLMIYFSGIEWQVEQRYIPNAVSTTAELVAINWPRTYFCIPVYCIETKKPYWFDAYTLKWKDAMGNELTV